MMDESLMTDPIGVGKVVETAVYKRIAAFYYQFAALVGYSRGGKRTRKLTLSLTIQISRISWLKSSTASALPFRMMMPLLNYARKRPRPSWPTISVLTIQHVAKSYYESLRLRSCICWAMLRSMVIEKWNDGKSSGDVVYMTVIPPSPPVRT